MSRPDLEGIRNRWWRNEEDPGDPEALFAYIEDVEQERDVARAEVAAFVRNEGDVDGVLAEQRRALIELAHVVATTQAQLATVTATRDEMIANIKKLARDLDDYRTRDRASK